MSLDRSLKSSGGLARHRNVLTRAEKIARLKSEDKWNEEQGIFKLPKVANRNIKVGKKTKKKEESTEEA
jgi:small basic protein (TIGR04137 family)